MVASADARLCRGTCPSDHSGLQKRACHTEPALHGVSVRKWYDCEMVWWDVACLVSLLRPLRLPAERVVSERIARSETLPAREVMEARDLLLAEDGVATL